MAKVLGTNFSDITAGADFFTTAAALTVSAANYSSQLGLSNGNGKAIGYGNGSASGTKSLPASYGTLHYHSRVRLNSANDDVVVDFREGSTVHVRINRNTSNQLQILRNTTLLATSAGAHPLGAFHLYVGSVIADAGGSVTVKVDGVDVVTFSGDTRNGGTSGVINQLSYPAGNSSYHFSDLWINDSTGSVNNGFDGVVRVVAGRMSADGASGVQFTRLSGAANYEMIDDTIGLHDGDITYNSGASAGLKDFFTVNASDFSGMAGTIVGTALVYWAKTPDGGTHTTRGLTKKGGTTTNGVTVAVSGSYTRYEDSLPLDPQTAAAWASFSAITSAEWGYEMVS